MLHLEKGGYRMAENNMFTEIQFMVFNRIALAHTLIDNDYRYELKNVGYGTYGKTPKCGGIMEIGFVEQNPVILKGEKGEFTIEENGKEINFEKDKTAYIRLAVIW